MCAQIFLFCLDLELFAKLKKIWFLQTRFYIFINNSNFRGKKKTKVPNNLWQILLSKKMCAKFQETILNSMVLGACLSFQFFIQKIWFLGNNKPFP